MYSSPRFFFIGHPSSLLLLLFAFSKGSTRNEEKRERENGEGDHATWITFFFFSLSLLSFPPEEIYIANLFGFPSSVRWSRKVNNKKQIFQSVGPVRVSLSLVIIEYPRTAIWFRCSKGSPFRGWNVCTAGGHETICFSPFLSAAWYCLIDSFWLQTTQ